MSTRSTERTDPYTPALTADLITEPSQFIALEDEWTALLQRCETSCVFFSHQWFASWWASFGAGSSLYLVCIRHKGELVGIAPLQRERTWFRGVPVWKLSLLANGYSAECGFLLDKPQTPILLAIIDFLILHKHQWRMYCVASKMPRSTLTM